MQEIFISLSRTDDVVPEICVETLRWDLSNYTYCPRQLFATMNLHILYHIYEIAKQNKDLVCPCDDVRSLPIDQLPFELIEMLLTRATGLFVTIHRTTPRAEAYTLATMWAVSNLWWVSLSHRKYIRRLLKRSFKRVFHPF